MENFHQLLGCWDTLSWFWLFFSSHTVRKIQGDKGRLRDRKRDSVREIYGGKEKQNLWNAETVQDERQTSQGSEWHGGKQNDSEEKEKGLLYGHWEEHVSFSWSCQAQQKEVWGFWCHIFTMWRKPDVERVGGEGHFLHSVVMKKEFTLNIHLAFLYPWLILFQEAGQSHVTGSLGKLLGKGNPTLRINLNSRDNFFFSFLFFFKIGV